MTVIWLWFIFVVIVGACVGSFLNVVIYRVPEGRSIVRPPSSCPKCGKEISWYDNIPVLSWLALGAKCRNCKVSISWQYPLIEAVTGLLFGALFLTYYVSGLRTDFPNGMQGLAQTWPVFLVHAALLASLIAATVIDARLFIIPLSIPWTATIVALMVLPTAAEMSPAVKGIGWSVGGKGMGMAIGGVIGLVLAQVLLMLRVIPRSFDLSKYTGDDFFFFGYTVAPPMIPPDTDQEWVDLPDARLQIMKEVVFVALPLIGAIIGYHHLVPNAETTWQGAATIKAPPVYSAWEQVLAGSVCGYLMGGLLIWGTRILGTLGFGREAMGLGDVHLLGAIGAVIGPYDVTLVFFFAPFIGLAYALVNFGLNQMIKVRYRPIPYGPHLCIVALLMMFGREPIRGYMGRTGDGLDNMFRLLFG